MRYIKKKYIKEIEFSDLDLENEDTILGHDEDGHDYDTIGEIDFNKFSWANESQEVEIDKMIDALKNLKKDGANYVEIMYHCDHRGYNLTGLEMREATKDEIKERKKKEKEAEKAVKQQEIDRLEKKLTKLKKS